MADTRVWPQGYRCAVAVTVDYNDIHGILTQAPQVAGRDKTLSVWRYGSQRGVERLLALLDELRVPATWFVPGIVAEENPGHVRAIQAAGHEIACAGYRHANYDRLSLAEQQLELQRGCQAWPTSPASAPPAFAFRPATGPRGSSRRCTGKAFAGRRPGAAMTCPSPTRPGRK